MYAESTSTDPAALGASDVVERKTSRTSSYSAVKEKQHDPEVQTAQEGSPEHDAEDKSKWAVVHSVLRPTILLALAGAILGWWICSTILKDTRHRWIVQTFWAWLLIITIAFRYIPNRVVAHPVSAVWMPCVQEPWYKLPYHLRLAIGWLCLLGIVFGSAFGFPLTEGTNYGDRAISVLGLFVFQLCFWLSSSNRSAVPWPTVIVGLFVQQVIAMFVLKTDAGYKIFHWIATAASDFLSQSEAGAAFFFSTAFVANDYFFVNTLAAVIFFIAFVQMMYYLGVMQWLIKGFAWFFFKLLNVSGAEAVIASASPFVGQGESACLVKPYVDLMTPSELHLTMTSGFSTISGSVLTAYINLGVPAQNLITASVMSIPASIAISKIRVPEVDEPVTRGRVVVDQGTDKSPPVNALHAFSRGAWFGLMVAGQILANVLTVVSLISLVNGLLTWIGKGFGIHTLTLQLILRYVFYPVTFFVGVPRNEILRVSELLATKLIENEFVGYTDLQAIMKSDNPLSERAFTIASYCLCGFANLSSLGIQIGVLSALAPSQAKVIAKIAPSAMICGFISTLQAAGIAGMLV
ncbi:H+/nucleoside cotransporter [Daedalea quercina L-15889]|uniref:H+/nucleoside cotransporter n=1 Tax=Daedalea quercina L-15889 TaxID=1314783 RepID=A0A165SL86_9APHY|nr:H+/nucleoside cotransporter [Daedalea quercina L-15889]